MKTSSTGRLIARVAALTLVCSPVTTGARVPIINVGAGRYSDLATAPAPAASGCAYLSVHDGDTIRCGRERIRLIDIDAPELPDSPKCRDARRSYAWCDFDLGYRSRDALRSFLAGGRVQIGRQGLDRYGRTLAYVSVNGRGAGDYLISRGLARPYR